jgi:C4-dicarboxylate transporter DctQ subunit
MKWILRILDYIEEGIIVIGLAVMTAMNFINVLSRYFFHQSISYTEEVVIIIFVWVTMMGISAGYKRHAHLGMSFVTDHLPAAGKRVAILFSAICSIVLIVFLVYYGREMVLNQIRFHSKTTALRLPTYIQGLAMPTGGVFMGIRTIQAFVDEWKKTGTDRKEEHA